MDNAEASGLPTLTLEHLPLSWPEDCHGAPLRPDRQAMGSSDAYLLKHSDNLDPERNEAQRLQEALELNRSLHIGYYLKEDLAQIWTQGSKASAAIFLDDWCRRARASGICLLQTVANTLQGHRTGILNWYDYPTSSGPMEGVNNKIGALQRAAYGYRDQQYFILKLFALHEAKFKFLV